MGIKNTMIPDMEATPSEKNMENFYYFDALRAFMVLLGIALHGTISYGIESHGASWPFSIGEQETLTLWPYKDAKNHAFFDYFHNVIHIFRMPLFFVMAGFFGKYSYEKEGRLAFMQKRKKRILYPLLVFWPILFGLVGLSLLPLLNLKRALTLDYVISVSGPIHLWFLFYLLYCYSAVILLERYLKSNFMEKFIPTFSSFMSIPLLSLFLAMIISFHGGAVNAAASFLPDRGAFLVYFIFFIFGWMNYGRTPKRINSYSSNALVFLLGFGIVFYLTFDLRNLAQSNIFVLSFLSAFSAWSLIFSSLGLARRIYLKPHPAVTYLSTSSYWLYIFHFPMVILMVYLLKDLTLPALTKGALVFLLSTTLLLVCYEFLVREGKVDRFLKGK